MCYLLPTVLSQHVIDYHDYDPVCLMFSLVTLTDLGYSAQSEISMLTRFGYANTVVKAISRNGVYFMRKFSPLW